MPWNFDKIINNYVYIVSCRIVFFVSLEVMVMAFGWESVNGVVFENITKPKQLTNDQFDCAIF